MSIEAIIFYLLFIDSVGAVLTAFIGEEWYVKHFRLISRWFPATKGWTLYYIFLVLWIGCLLYRLKVIF